MTEIKQKRSYISGFSLSFIVLFISSYLSAFITWVSFNYLEKGSDYFTKPFIGWGSVDYWYESAAGITLFAQILASPGLLIYLFILARLWQKQEEDFEPYILSGIGLATLNGAVFIRMEIIALFFTTGLLTSILCYLCLGVISNHYPKKQ